jgi:hypothetical protein
VNDLKAGAEKSSPHQWKLGSFISLCKKKL